MVIDWFMMILFFSCNMITGATVLSMIDNDKGDLREWYNSAPGGFLRSHVIQGLVIQLWFVITIVYLWFLIRD